MDQQQEQRHGHSHILCASEKDEPGTLPPHPSLAPLAPLSPLSPLGERRQRHESEEDEEERQKQIKKDDWKDTHKRGAGNRKNRS